MDNIKRLSKRNEKMLWVGSWTSKIGDKLFDYANSVFIVGLGGPAATILAFYQSAETIIGVFFNLIGGVVADGYSRKKICIITDLLSGITCFILAPLLQSRVIGLYMIIANAVLAIIHAFNSPTYKSIVREVILKDRIKQFNAIARAVNEIIKVASPIIGLALVNCVGVRGALLIDGCTFVFSAGLETLLNPLPGCENKPAKRKAVWSEMKEGLLYIKNEYWILFLLILSGIVNFFLAGYNLLLPFTENIFINEVGFYGKAMMAEALGGIVGAFLCSKLKAQETIRTMVLYLAATGLWLIFIPILSTIVSCYVCLCFYFLFSGSLTIYNIQFSTYIQTHVRTDYIGRVFSIVYTVAVLFMPIGSFVFSSLFTNGLINNYYVIGGGIVASAFIGLFANKIINKNTSD